MVESGPASGFWGAAELGRLIGEPNVLALDIGGTTAKCSLIEGGQVQVISDYWIERSRLSAGYPIMVPVVDLVEIGNGGGSIAWVDDFGKLHVGPASRPAPFPARPPTGAAGRRRRRRTRTSSSAASTATTSAAARSRPTWRRSGARSTRSPARLGVDRAEAARGVVRIANNNMVNALKLISVNRGYDPRDFTLVAFGGGGGMHAVALAAELGIRKVVIPRAADVFSAWGMLMSDLRRDYFLTRLVDLTPRERRAARGGLRRARREPRSTQFAARGDRRRAGARSAATATCATRTRSTASRSRCPTARSTRAAIEAIEARLPRRVRARVHLPARRVRSSSSAATSSRSPRSASSTPAPAAGDRPVARGRLEGRRAASTTRPRASTRPTIYDGDLLEPGMAFAGPGDRRDEGHDDGRPSGQRRRGRRLRQPRDRARGRRVTAASRPSRSRSRSSRARCRRRATRCSPRSARRR